MSRAEEYAAKTEKKRRACGRIRILTNAMMAAGFFELVLVFSLGEGPAAVGAAVLSVGFLGKLFGWRCPQCAAHLLLCLPAGEHICPVCGCKLKVRRDEKDRDKT